jgi:hypothetical protein
MRPVKPEHLFQAIGAYRAVLRVLPENVAAFARLALLYEATGNFGELGHIAARRLELRPDDPAAVIAQVKDLLFRERRDAARAALEGLVARLAEGSGPATSSTRRASCGRADRRERRPDAGPPAAEWLISLGQLPDSGWRWSARRPAAVLAGTPPGDAEEQSRLAREDLERAETLRAPAALAARAAALERAVAWLA